MIIKHKVIIQNYLHHYMINKAIDFLRSKINKDIGELYDRKEPNNRTITKE